jgi:protease I
MELNNKSVSQKRVAILIENGVEDSEFLVPYNAFKMSEAETVVLGSRMNEKYKGKQGKMTHFPDGTTTEARPEDFDAVIIPGGMAPDKMRCNPNTVRFVQNMMEQGKWVAAVCHGPQVLIEGDLLHGKNATGFVSIRKDMMNAGALYLNKPVVIDGNLITSRQPGDLAIFTTAILHRLGLGKQAGLPDENNNLAEWWKLADAWGGSTKGEIAKALNTALAGEHYSLEALEQYSEKADYLKLKLLLKDFMAIKRQHINHLETRLQDLGEKPSLPSAMAEPYAKLKSWLQSSDDIAITKRALGDIQTGVVDVFNLRVQTTDPVSTALFTEIEQHLAAQEQQLAELYQAMLGSKSPQPATPSTGAAVSI